MTTTLTDARLLATQRALAQRTCDCARIFTRDVELADAHRHAPACGYRLAEEEIDARLREVAEGEEEQP